MSRCSIPRFDFREVIDRTSLRIESAVTGIWSQSPHFPNRTATTIHQAGDAAIGSHSKNWGNSLSSQNATSGLVDPTRGQQPRDPGYSLPWNRLVSLRPKSQ